MVDTYELSIWFSGNLHCASVSFWGASMCDMVVRQTLRLWGWRGWPNFHLRRGRPMFRHPLERHTLLVSSVTNDIYYFNLYRLDLAWSKSQTEILSLPPASYPFQPQVHIQLAHAPNSVPHTIIPQHFQKDTVSGLPEEMKGCYCGLLSGFSYPSSVKQNIFFID